MADRYQDRNFMADDLDRGMPPRGPARVESDPLAELARLIGQNDPFAGSARPAAPRVQPRAPVAPGAAPEPVRPPQAGLDDPLAAAGPPPWVQRGSRPEAPRPPQVSAEQDPQGSVHPVHRYGNAGSPQQQEEEAFADDEDQPEASRYDDTLFGQVDDGSREFRRDQGYSDDPYAFEEDGYDEGEDEDPKKRGGLTKIFTVLVVLAVIGTGGAFAYRALVSSSRSGEPPIIRADNSPTKIMPGPMDGSAKVPDRLGDGAEKMVSREEAPVDVNSRSVGPRVVPLTQSNNAPPPATNLASNDPPPPVTAPSNLVPNNNVALGNGEPRRIKTFSVHGDQAADGTPAAAPAAPPPTPKSARGRKAAASANASADTPLSLSPRASAAPAAAADTRVASANSAPSTDSGAAPAGSYMVQVSSQPSEAAAQASYKVLQTKFADVLGQYSPVIQRADLPDKTVYRAMVGPFGTSGEAVQLCTSLKTAGGQCFVPKK
jgi:hypothetical protein